MKFLVAFAAVLAVATAAPQYLARDFGAVVEGPKTVIEGPSGIISSHTGAISKTILPDLIAPKVLPISRTIAPVVGTHLVTPTFINRGLVNTVFDRSLLFDDGSYKPELYDRKVFGEFLL